MVPYFEEFASFNQHLDDSPSFTVHVYIRGRTNERTNETLRASSAIPTSTETIKAVMAAIAASTAGEYREPFMLWTGRSVVVIPAEEIEQIRLEFSQIDRSK